ncbi:MAG TPA: PQQ-dependent sugar dehydrogenase [Xanthobacteraceae bacterium]|nr:PQQ-dependent sugar dehydrogenase [Xanthobacteraceae bacterium]
MRPTRQRLMIRASLCAIAASAAFAAGALGAPQTFPSSAGPIQVETVADGLQHPWALAFLPDGRMLVTERPGRLRVVTPDGKVSPPIAGLPKIFARGQGGLHDVAVDRGFSQNRTIYFCYAEPSGSGARTALARARLADEPYVENLRVIFRQEGPLSTGNHFGCRIVQMPDNNLFLTMGDHFTPRDEAQNLSNHLGKIVRIAPDGSVPNDNPFAGRRGAKPEIWSYGHRNSQGAALHPSSGKLWMHEHGPRGGDEINIPQAGKNYGWPVIGFGVDYSGAKIHEGTSKPGMEQPIQQWTPVIAPSGMAFYTADLFPQWKNNLFIGGLVARALVRLELEGEKVTKEERLLQELRQRIRDVRAGPDGALWLLTDSANGQLLRLTPGR